jgi:hypothetical protein
MLIKELKNTENYKYITVQFNYEEIRDLTNSLCHTLHPNELSMGDYERECYEKLQPKMLMLFDLIKHQMITSHSIQKYEQLYNKTTGSTGDAEGGSKDANN